MSCWVAIQRVIGNKTLYESLQKFLCNVEGWRGCELVLFSFSANFPKQSAEGYFKGDGQIDWLGQVIENSLSQENLLERQMSEKILT